MQQCSEYTRKLTTNSEMYTANDLNVVKNDDNIAALKQLLSV